MNLELMLKGKNLFFSFFFFFLSFFYFKFTFTEIVQDSGIICV